MKGEHDELEKSQTNFIEKGIFCTSKGCFPTEKKKTVRRMRCPNNLVQDVFGFGLSGLQSSSEKSATLHDSNGNGGLRDGTKKSDESPREDK